MKNKNSQDQQLLVLQLELASQREENQCRVAELAIATKELAIRNEDKRKREADSILAGVELDFQNAEKGKRAAELLIANIELVFQNEEKEKKAYELVITNEELAFQYEEKNKLAEQLMVANRELVFQNEEKEKRAAELTLANIELAFQNKEKQKRAAELVIANIELAIQHIEKNKRAAELLIANKELVFQNELKEHQAAELVAVNLQLALHNEEKEQRTADLILANKTLLIENEDKEQRALELSMANKELKQFAYIASHDLREPLRTISNYIEVFELEYWHLLEDNARGYIHSINSAAKQMNILIGGLLDFSRIGRDKELSYVDSAHVINAVLVDLRGLIKTSKTIVHVGAMPMVNAYEIEVGQLFRNLITNAIKFTRKDSQPKIEICSEKINDMWRFSITDNGIGIAVSHHERVFDLFQRLHGREKYEGNGVGLANCKKIIQLHRGKIWIESEIGKGSTFHFTIPA